MVAGGAPEHQEIISEIFDASSSVHSFVRFQRLQTLTSPTWLYVSGTLQGVSGGVSFFGRWQEALQNIKKSSARNLMPADDHREAAQLQSIQKSSARSLMLAVDLREAAQLGQTHAPGGKGGERERERERERGRERKRQREVDIQRESERERGRENTRSHPPASERRGDNVKTFSNTLT